MNAVDWVIRWSTALVVLGVAAIAQVSTTFTVDMDMGVAKVLPSPVRWGGLQGCAPIAWCHVCDAPVFAGCCPVSGLLCFVRHLPWGLRPYRRVPRCVSTRRPTGLRLRRGGPRRRGGGLIRRGARRRRAGSCGYRIPLLPRRPRTLPQAPGRLCRQFPLCSGRCTSRIARRGCARARWRLRFWGVTRTLK